ncbi:MAG TPA: hypothetical protein VGG44_06255 [Tepidisphaeraceae bacterium]
MSSTKLIHRIICIAILFCAPSAMADNATTQPAGAKDTFKEYLRDLSQGKPDQLPDLCSARDDDSRAIVRDFQAIATAIGHLRAASAKKFGPDAVDMVMPQMALPDSADTMTETDKDGVALLSGPEAGSVQMISSDGHWKLDMDWLRHNPDFPSSADYFKLLAQAVQRTADDIDSGRLDTPQAAIEAMRARQDGIPDSSPATQPTTQPTEQPTGQP